jgi:hypothetical protein
MSEAEKKCRRCGELKPIEEFVWRRKAAGKRGPYCKHCRASYAQAHYAANRQLYIERARRRKQVVGEQRVAYLVEFLSAHPCVDCGESDPIVLEFDHLADKAFTIGEGLRDRNWDSVLAEIAKCDVVCANCHRRRTARRGGFLRTAMIGEVPSSGAGRTRTPNRRFWRPEL